VISKTPDFRSLAARFIVFEGLDGSGKTTQLNRFAGACRDQGLAIELVREPGGTPAGERIRDLLLHGPEMDVMCEMLLYMAARAQLCRDVIRPALEAGRLVIADRFVQSTLAYQGAGGGVDEDDIREIARIATGGVTPDLVVIFDVDDATAQSRLGGQRDRMESKGDPFRARVRAGYLAQADAAPERHAVIDAAGPEDDVWRRTQQAISQWAAAAVRS
jgi:dTMP kinase